MNKTSYRHMFFAGFSALWCIAFYDILSMLFTFSLESNVYSHILGVPFISLFFAVRTLKKGGVQRSNRYTHSDVLLGGLLLLSGTATGLLASFYIKGFSDNDFLSAFTLSAVLVFWGGVVLCYGYDLFRNLRFPLIFMLFMVPVPEVVYNLVISVLQQGSAEVTSILLGLSNTPVIREGLTFHLYNLSIDIAPQCSGIRSSIALVVLSAIMGHVYLKTGRFKVMLIMIALTFTFIKNGIRITTLTLLGVYLDKGYINDSVLHSRGGILFFIFTLALIFPVFTALRYAESVTQNRKMCK